MDDLIQTFIDNYFSDELASQLYKSLGLMTVFGYTTVHQDLPEIIMQEQDEHREVIVDQVVHLIQGGIDKVLDAHRVRLSGEASLSFKNKFLEALFALGFRENYMPYQIVLENWTLTNEEKLAEILADIMDEDNSNVLEHLEWVYDGTMNLLAELINTKLSEEKKAEDLDLLRTIRRHLKAYQTSFGTPASVQGLLDINMAMGCTFQTYLNLFQDAIINLGDMESTTFNLIWIALISQDGTENPQKLLLEVSESLFNDIQHQQAFSRMLQKAMGRFQEYKEHQS